MLEGEVTLELDEGELVNLRQGDYLVQNGTRHAWHNFTTQLAHIAVIVLGTGHTGFQ